MTVVFTVVGAIGLASNMFVMLVVASSRQLRQQPRNWFIFSQSLADFINAIFIVTLFTKSSTMQLYVSTPFNQLK
jgi:hypothetical protein